VPSQASARPPGLFTYTHAAHELLKVKDVGRGSVTSSPAGVECGKDCSHSFPYGKSVTLKAHAHTGSLFAGWSGACTGMGRCTVRMTGPKVVRTRFVRRPSSR
jgi:hypothetical protein